MSRRGRAAILALLVALGAGLGSSGRAGAAPLRDCTPTRGTIVAVDFGRWDGPVVRGCGLGAASGYALLHQAGFTTAGDQHDGPAFICRLGDAAFHAGTEYPTARQDACILTPPANAYWAFWFARAGQSHWTYSALGAMGDAPHGGEVELWTFGGTNPAGTKGSGLPAIPPSSLRSTAGTRTSRVRIVAAQPTSDRARAGSPVALIVGLAIAAVLGVGAVRTVIVRRREE